VRPTPKVVMLRCCS